MKIIIKISILSILFFVTKSIYSQTENSKYIYCEMVGVQKMLSTKVNIVIDFGEERSLWKGNTAIIDEATGKAQTFNSMVDALNYMGEKGWELAQAYVVTTPQGGGVYHWLLKRKIE
jgi:hypothetical protein